MIRRRLFWKTYPYLFVIIVVALVLTSLFASSEMRRLYLGEIADTLTARARLVSTYVSSDLANHNQTALDNYCKEFGALTGTRITIIDSAGTVLGDSDEDPKIMENHGSRPEIALAIAGKIGTETRFSNTLQTTMMYVAVPVHVSGTTVGVVRTALSTADVSSSLMTFYERVTIGGIFIILLTAISSSLIFRRFTRPIHDLQRGAELFAEGQLKSKLPVADTEEIAALSITMNKMAAHLDSRINKIVEQRNEREAILTSMTEGVLALDNRERIVSFNRAAARLLDLSFEVSLGKPIHEVARVSDLHNFVDRVKKTKDQEEMEILVPGFPERYLLTHGSILKDASGEKTGILLVFNDITRLKKLENIRKDFVANVSHELKTPITAITGSVETLLEGAVNNAGDNKRFLTMIATHANRLNRLVEDLLSLARLEAETDKSAIKLSSTGICDILSSAIQSFQPKDGEKSSNVNLVCDENLKGDVNAFHLEQAVINLIDNALKYGGPEVEIEVKGELINKEIIISVSDNGAGIEKQHLSRLFERFYTVDKGRSHEAGGTGLGLAIVKHVALAHKGRISVESALGKGSCFKIHLPYYALRS